MTKGKIVLVPFPFDDLTSEKVRPALCLTDLIGPHRHVIVAFHQQPDSNFGRRHRHRPRSAPQRFCGHGIACCLGSSAASCRHFNQRLDLPGVGPVKPGIAVRGLSKIGRPVWLEGLVILEQGIGAVLSHFNRERNALVVRLIFGNLVV